MRILNFGTPGYLDVYNNKKFISLVEEGIKKYGYNFGGSRLSNFCPDVYSHAEKKLASWCNTESSVITSSGTLSAQLLINYLKKCHENSVFYVQHDIHPSLNFEFKEKNSFRDIDILAGDLAKLDYETEKYIIFNSINPITLNRIGEDELKRFKDLKNITFIVDDSHGFGLNKEKSLGITMKSLGYEYIIIGSLAKGIGLDGGVMAGKNKLVEQIMNDELCVGASPPPPYLFYAFLYENGIYDMELNKLERNMKAFIDKCPYLDSFDHIDRFPVFIAKRKIHLPDYIRIASFSYPHRFSAPTQRIVLNSGHTIEDINTLCEEMSMK